MSLFIQDLKGKNSKEILKEFTSIFDRMSLKYGSYDVFDNLLDCTINSLSLNYDEKVMQRIRDKYTQQERHLFGEMIKMWILIMNKEIKINLSYDFWGNFYELNAMNKEKGFAQYFTPEKICRLIVQMNLLQQKDIRKNVYEPTCGSGKLNLAINEIKPTLFHWANDLDITCTKMTALNLFIHGIRGIVTCDDALFPKTKFRGAFIINEDNVLGIQFCTDVEEVYSYIALNTETTNLVQPSIEFINKPSQLNLF